MGIIKTITSLFTSTPRDKRKPFPDSVFDDDDYEDIDAENEERDRLLRVLYNKTKNQQLEINSYIQDAFVKKHAISFHFIPNEQNKKNVRSYIEYTHGNWKKWQEIRLHYFAKHNHVCQSCKKTFDDKGLNLHELWDFNESSKIQKLIALIPLCPECHSIAHINRHKKEPEKIIALIEKYASYNKVSEDQSYADMDLAERERTHRQGIKYKLDMSLLSDFLATSQLFDCHTDDFNDWLKANFKDSE
ncbi:HNH endonuclease [Burkholderia glumae]